MRDVNSNQIGVRRGMSCRREAKGIGLGLLRERTQEHLVGRLRPIALLKLLAGEWEPSQMTPAPLRDEMKVRDRKDDEVDPPGDKVSIKGREGYQSRLGVRLLRPNALSGWGVGRKVSSRWLGCEGWRH